ncbi:MAG: hypothetical protein M1834_009685 [Cirrosporium novae-zelandiae]|nr:MAG: hypothetical protein M1834_009685 [Cirrosporium novae-zelandiae]
MPSKSPYLPPTTTSYTRAPRGVSPPEAPYSATASTSGTFSASGRSSDYAGSASGEYETSSVASARGVDLVELLNDRLPTAFDTMPLDKGLARQAQTSGELNAKQRELMELQALAQRRLKSTRANFADGMKAAKEVKRDLEWTQKKVNTLKSKAERKHPEAYQRASEMYPAPCDY